MLVTSSVSLSDPCGLNIELLDSNKCWPVVHESSFNTAEWWITQPIEIFTQLCNDQATVCLSLYLDTHSHMFLSPNNRQNSLVSVELSAVWMNPMVSSNSGPDSLNFDSSLLHYKWKTAILREIWTCATCGCSGQHRSVSVQLAEPERIICQEKGANPSYLHWPGLINRSTCVKVWTLFTEPTWASEEEAQSTGGCTWIYCCVESPSHRVPNQTSRCSHKPNSNQFISASVCCANSLSFICLAQGCDQE